MTQEFNYQEAFKRNIGWVTEKELETLRKKRVAIAGVGGVGGGYALMLARLGIGNLTLADPDQFELANFNRQSGANLETIGRSKVDVIAEMAKNINPELNITVFHEGVTQDNMDDFLKGADLYLDGLDFFVLDMREILFAACAKKHIPATTVAPFGMGAALINFHPEKMSFEDYFRMAGRSQIDKALHFLVGLAPRFLQGGYLVDATKVDLQQHKGPSTPMSVQLCAGVAGTEVLKILLDRGKIYWAPWSVHYDAYRYKLVKSWRPWGNHNPLQQLLLFIAKRLLIKNGK